MVRIDAPAASCAGTSIAQFSIVQPFGEWSGFRGIFGKVVAVWLPVAYCKRGIGLRIGAEVVLPSELRVEERQSGILVYLV